MTLVKTSILTLISTVIKVLSAFLVNKVIAIYIGPSGLAIIGQLQNFIYIFSTFSTGAISQGVVKYTAEYKTIDQQQKIFSTSLFISVTCSVLASFVLVVFHEYWAVSLLKEVQYSNVFIVFGITIFLFSLNTILLSVLNGRSEIRKFIYANIANSLVALVVTTLLIKEMFLVGALYALVTNQSIVFFVTLFFVLKSNWFHLSNFTQGLDVSTLKKLSKYSLMAIVSAVTIPVSHLIVRDYIGETLSWDAAGYWQGVWYISAMYLLVITTLLNVYLLPKLSSLSDKSLILNELKNSLKYVIPLLLLMTIVVYNTRYIIIDIAFTDDFLEMEPLFKWQLVGDIVKMCAWILGYVLIAKAMTKIYIFTEIIFASLFTVLSIIFINLEGLIGITYAHVVHNALYLVYLIYVLKKYYFSNTYDEKKK